MSWDKEAGWGDGGDFWEDWGQGLAIWAQPMGQLAGCPLGAVPTCHKSSAAGLRA